MGRDTFDAVLASVPNGATAGRVTSRGEAAWTPKQQISPGQLHWDVPPPMFQWSPTIGQQLPDYTGRKYGRLTVVGLMRIRADGSGLRWVVRCACGHYEARTSKAVRNSGGDRCHNCESLKSIQNRYEVLGPRPIEDFTEKGLV